MMMTSTTIVVTINTVYDSAMPQRRGTRWFSSHAMTGCTPDAMKAAITKTAMVLGMRVANHNASPAMMRRAIVIQTRRRFARSTAVCTADAAPSDTRRVRTGRAQRRYPRSPSVPYTAILAGEPHLRRPPADDFLYLPHDAKVPRPRTPRTLTA